MTPAEYVTEIACPTVRDFRDNPRSRRHAYLACIATFHIKDHLKKAGETGIENKMRSTCRKSFDLVRSICNGAKHVATNASHAIPFNAGSDFDRPPAVLSEMVLDLSLLGDTKGGREIGQGQDRTDIYSACKDALINFKANFGNHLGGCDLSDC